MIVQAGYLFPQIVFLGAVELVTLDLLAELFFQGGQFIVEVGHGFGALRVVRVLYIVRLGLNIHLVEIGVDVLVARVILGILHVIPGLG